MKTQLENDIFQVVNNLNNIPTERSTPGVDTLINALPLIWVKLDKANDINSITEIKKATDECTAKADKLIKEIVKEIEQEATKEKKKAYDKKYRVLVDGLIHVLGDVNELITVPMSADEQIEMLDDTFNYKKPLNFPVLTGKLNSTLQKHGFSKDQADGVIHLWRRSMRQVVIF